MRFNIKNNIFIIISAYLFVLLLSYGCEQDVSVSPPVTRVPIASVIIQSEPDGASIYENGLISGLKTPDTLYWLEEREYSFTLKKKYHKDTSFSVIPTVDSSQMIFIDYYKNSSMLGSANFSSTPNNVEVYFQNEYIGITPSSISGIKPGEFYFVFKKENHRSDSILVPINSSQTSKVEVELEDTTYWVDYSVMTSGIHDNVLSSVAVDQNDVVWVGSKNGVSSYDGKEWRYYSSDNSGLIGTIINSIKVDKENNKWFATNGGISKYNGSFWVNESKSTSPTFPDYWVEDIEFLEDGRKIIATKNGLGISSNNEWKVTRFSSEPYANWFTDVAVIDENDIWITHKTSGVLHLDGSKLGVRYFAELDPPSILTFYNCVEIAEDAVWFGHSIVEPDAMAGLSAFRFSDNKFSSGYPELWGIEVYNIKIKNGIEKWIASKNGLHVFTNYYNRKLYNIRNTPLKAWGIFDVAFDSKGDAWIATDGAGLYHFKVTQLK